MATSRVICRCGAVLKKDEREYHLYQCTACVMREQEVIDAYRRGEDHPDIETLFSGPVLIEGVVSRRQAPAPRLDRSPAGPRRQSSSRA